MNSGNNMQQKYLVILSLCADANGQNSSPTFSLCQLGPRGSSTLNVPLKQFITQRSCTLRHTSWKHGFCVYFSQ